MPIVKLLTVNVGIWFPAAVWLALKVKFVFEFVFRVIFVNVTIPLNVTLEPSALITAPDATPSTVLLNVLVELSIVRTPVAGILSAAVNVLVTLPPEEIKVPIRVMVPVNVRVFVAVDAAFNVAPKAMDVVLDAVKSLLPTTSVPAVTVNAPVETVRSSDRVQVEPDLFTVNVFKVVSSVGRTTAVVPTTERIGGVVFVIVAPDAFVQVPLKVTVAAAVLKVIFELSFCTMSPRYVVLPILTATAASIISEEVPLSVIPPVAVVATFVACVIVSVELP